MRKEKDKKFYKNFSVRLNNIVEMRYSKRSEFAAEYSAKYEEDIAETMKNWFSGRSMPDAKVLCNISNVLDCDVDYLVGRQCEYKRLTANVAKQLELDYESIEKIEKYPSEIKELLDRLILNQTGDNLLKLLKSINDYAVDGHNVFLQSYDASFDSRNIELEDKFDIPVLDRERSKEVLKHASAGVMGQVLDSAYNDYVADANLLLKKRLDTRCRKEKERFLMLAENVSSIISNTEKIELGEWTNWGKLSNDEVLEKIERKYQSRYKMYSEVKKAE